MQPNKNKPFPVMHHKNFSGPKTRFSVDNRKSPQTTYNGNVFSTPTTIGTGTGTESYTNSTTHTAHTNAQPSPYFIETPPPFGYFDSIDNDIDPPSSLDDFAIRAKGPMAMPIPTERSSLLKRNFVCTPDVSLHHAQQPPRKLFESSNNSTSLLMSSTTTTDDSINDNVAHTLASNRKPIIATIPIPATLKNQQNMPQNMTQTSSYTSAIQTSTNLPTQINTTNTSNYTSNFESSLNTNTSKYDPCQQTSKTKFKKKSSVSLSFSKKKLSYFKKAKGIAKFKSSSGRNTSSITSTGNSSSVCKYSSKQQSTSHTYSRSTVSSDHHSQSVNLQTCESSQRSILKYKFSREETTKDYCKSHASKKEKDNQQKTDIEKKISYCKDVLVQKLSDPCQSTGKNEVFSNNKKWKKNNAGLVNSGYNSSASTYNGSLRRKSSSEPCSPSRSSKSSRYKFFGGRGNVGDKSTTVQNDYDPEIARISNSKGGF